MRITALETVRLGEFPNLCFVRLHTDAGLVGLGETFFGALEVEAYLHATAAPARTRSSAIDGLRVGSRPFSARGHRRRGPRQPGGYRPLGSLGKAAGRSVCQPRRRRARPSAFQHAPDTGTSKWRPAPTSVTGAPAGDRRRPAMRT
jgi:hypothetical protein